MEFVPRRDRGDKFAWPGFSPNHGRLRSEDGHAADEDGVGNAVTSLACLRYEVERTAQAGLVQAANRVVDVTADEW